MADVADFLAPLYLQLPELPLTSPRAVECPSCFALVLEARLEDHQRASHG